MNNINLTSNKYIRDIILFADLVIALGVIEYFIEFGHINIERPSVLLVLSIISMMVSQACFSTILHHHYASFDKVMARTTALLFSYSLILFVSCSVVKWSGAYVMRGQSVGVIAAVTAIAIFVSRLIEILAIKIGRKYNRNTRSITFVGDADRIAEILRDINYSVTTGLRLTGYFSPEQDDYLNSKMKYLGNYDALEAMLNGGKRGSDEVYSALTPSYKALNQKLIQHCMHHVIHFYYVPTFLGEYGEYLKPSVIGEQVVFANFSEPLLDPMKRFVKRVFDIVCSGLALLVLLPFFPIIALIIKLKSPGPVFFRQARTGRGGKDFNMLKFRSMHVNADADKVQATKDDPRKYPFGNFMRKTSIDELPQLWNIFVGDMSIVGPRPHMKAHTEQYSKLIDDYMLRHFIRPGLTGWAQVNGYRGETSELWQMEGRVKRDIWYIQNWTFWLDIRIIFRTAWQIITKDEQAY